ncbi:MAG: acetylxylan esterase [Thermonemataceae bacterium]
MNKILTLLIIITLLSCVNDNDIVEEQPFEYAFSKQHYQHDLTDTSIPYHIFEPKQSLNTTDKFPLILALHGAEYFATAEEDFLFNETFGYYALAWIEENNQNQYPAYVLAPHIHEELWKGNDYNNWSAPNSLDFLEKLLEEVMKHKNIDAERVYLTGHSMGGAGTWIVGAHLKDKVAALVPLSTALGASSPGFDALAQQVEKGSFAQLPVWSFIHKRDADGSGSEHACRVLFQAFDDKGYEPTFTHGFEETQYNLTSAEINEVISEGKIHFYTEYNYDCYANCHYAMTEALREPFLFRWLFMQKRSDNY